MCCSFDKKIFYLINKLESLSFFLFLYYIRLVFFNSVLFIQFLIRLIHFQNNTDEFVNKCEFLKFWNRTLTEIKQAIKKMLIQITYSCSMKDENVWCGCKTVRHPLLGGVDNCIAPLIPECLFDFQSSLPCYQMRQYSTNKISCTLDNDKNISFTQARCISNCFQ